MDSVGSLQFTKWLPVSHRLNIGILGGVLKGNHTAIIIDKMSPGPLQFHCLS